MKLPPMKSAYAGTGDDLTQATRKMIESLRPIAADALKNWTPRAESSWASRDDALWFRWGLTNSKYLKAGIVPFGISPLITCPYAGACAAYCLARAGNWRYTPTVRARAWNTALVEAALAEGGPARLAGLLESDLRFLVARQGFQYVRINDSGDFYTAEYAEAWRSTAKALPDLKFYAYTKSAPILAPMRVRWPNNLRIWRSVGASRGCQRFRLPASWQKRPLVRIISSEDLPKYKKPGTRILVEAADEKAAVDAEMRGEKVDLILKAKHGAGTVLALLVGGLFVWRALKARSGGGVQSEA